MPWTFDFEGPGETPPAHWINATAKFAVRAVDGNRVLVKLAENPFAFAKRARPFFGQTDLSNYTIEADVRSMEKRRQMGDVGIVAQRYELVLFGNHQRVELQPWQPEVTRTVKAEYKWKPDTWYVMKLEVQTLAKGQVRARGKVWPKGEQEPAAWTVERVDPIGNLKGSPGLYADAMNSAAGGGSEMYYDNIKVYRNKSGALRPERAVWRPRVAIECRQNHEKTGTSCSRCCSAGSVSVPASNPGPDWPMWGGAPDRNMVSTMKGLPTAWDLKAKKNVKWVAELGSQTYGNPVVAGGTVFVGTNNEAPRDPNIKGDKGILMAFRESDGEFLWQAVHDKLAAGRANDWPFQGICSSPLVENGVVITCRIAAS